MELADANPKKRRVAVVIGSSRPARICPGIAAWTRDVIADGSDLTYEILDLADVALPLLDEPRMAALHQYEHDHTRAWSHLVQSFDAFLFVFPQYNWGYPAVLKNALDFLYDEWSGKPVSFLTYGNHGGNRAASQLIEVLTGLHMKVLDHVEAVITRADIDERWQLIDVGKTLQPTAAQLAAINTQMIQALSSETTASN